VYARLLVNSSWLPRGTVLEVSRLLRGMLGALGTDILYVTCILSEEGTREEDD
jgi:hypothetical protein